MINRGEQSPTAPRAFGELARRLLQHPTAPYHEHAVRLEAEHICALHGLDCERDRFGNLVVRLRNSKTGRPLVLAAHLDHPGFEIVRPLSPGRWIGQFQGGVPESYFRRGTALHLMPGRIPARLGNRRANARKEFEILAESPAQLSPRFATWALPDFKLKHGRIYSRACDDLIGVAAILATLIELKRIRARVHVIGVLSRAEEVGFQGALALASAVTLPKHSLVISLETSRELPGVKMGEGVIVRVGDRASVFDSGASRFLVEVAGELVKENPFSFQRALMGGGTCEASAYQEFGYQCAAVCVALGNYHNCGSRGLIEMEYVSLSDACGMVRLLVEASRQMPRYEELIERFPNRLRTLLRDAKGRLPGTA
ncbi:MAG TPA: M20/M25/M40 family metallo-hydrolase [Verrucomicrobiae bacterium]|nr:M20/M25/M40 family metallo-hydrolase [Verrucomicrobiae bacterium]